MMTEPVSASAIAARSPAMPLPMTRKSPRTIIRRLDRLESIA
jgi:hypothetical protein